KLVRHPQQRNVTMLATPQPLFKCFWPALSAALLILSGFTPARADDLLDKQRRENTLRTQELKLKMTDLMRDVRDEAKENPARVADLLRAFRVEVESARFLSDADRKALLRILDRNIAYLDRRRQDTRPPGVRDRGQAPARNQFALERTLTGHGEEI